jgi:AraC-like DNA-binding protein
MAFEYSTAEVEAARRFEYWKDVVCRHCIPADSRMLTEGPFDGRLAVRSVGVVDISAMTAPQHRWWRDAHHLRVGNDEDLWIGYLREGEGTISQRGRHANLRGGDMVLYDGARLFDCTLASQTTYMVRFPRRSLLQRCAAAELLTARTLDDSKPAVAQLRSMIEQAAGIDFEQRRSGVAEQFGTTLLDLVAVVLEFQMDDRAPRAERDLYARMVAYIRRHFEEPDLRLEMLANAHGVSTRTVTRTFARHNQTPMGMAWRLRLEASQRALMEGRSRSVTEAAFDHGFSDVSHFSHAFRKAFGYAPHTLIRGH